MGFPQMSMKMCDVMRSDGEVNDKDILAHELEDNAIENWSAPMPVIDNCTHNES